jgi:IS5 family transposase
MVEGIEGWVTLGADKGYDRKEFVLELREHQVTPHVARKPTSIIDARTTRHPGYAISQQKRKRIEEIYGWLKTVGGLRKNSSSWSRQGRLDVHLCAGRLQPGQDAQSAARICMKPRLR